MNAGRAERRRRRRLRDNEAGWKRHRGAKEEKKEDEKIRATELSLNGFDEKKKMEKNLKR